MSKPLGAPGVAIVTLSRPTKGNSFTLDMWRALGSLMNELADEPAVRCILLNAAGPNFCTGMDVSVFAAIAGAGGSQQASISGLDQDASQHDQSGGPVVMCPGRIRLRLHNLILDLQAAVTSLEECRKPVVVAIQGKCIGAGVDLCTAADIRICSADATFCVKEVDLAIPADMGTAQRLPRLIPPGIANELIYTGIDVSAERAFQLGLVSQVCATCDDLDARALQLCVSIASKSPLTIRGIKETLLHARDHASVPDNLRQIASWNAGMLLSEDLDKATKAVLAKRKTPPLFSKL